MTCADISMLSWYLGMSWCQVGTRSSANTMMTELWLWWNMHHVTQHRNWDTVIVPCSREVRVRRYWLYMSPWWPLLGLVRFNRRVAWSSNEWQRYDCHQTSSISCTKSKKKSLMFLFWSCSCLCLIHWSQVLSREWRCCWSSTDRRCSNYIWVIKSFIAY